MTIIGIFFYLMETKIAIQGIRGSFHHQVAQDYFKASFEVTECMSFPELVLNVVSQKVSAAVMALENSIAGAIISNYALIDQYNLQITGEYYLSISMNVMALKGQTLADIKEVQSHPIALLQCQRFFENYPHIKLVESPDTAETAKRIQEQQLKGIAALASPVAATLFDLEILAEAVHTIQNNTTRFVILGTSDEIDDRKEKNKASLKFELNDQQGSLAQILQEMDSLGLNMTKIQSLPIIEKPWNYSFFVDVIFERYENFEKASVLLSQKTKEFKVLGIYKNRRI